jgi:DNA replication and repair protein RecF
MRAERIRLENFRNYTDETVEFSRGINVITGANAQGKTNLLEGVFCLSCGRAFRTRFDRELVRFGENSARVTGEVFSGDRPRTIEIRMGGGVRKRVLCNEVPSAVSELPRVFRVVLFSPDDLNMIRDGAAERRRFLDMAISQLRPGYAGLIGEYSRVYDHKRRILSDWREKPSLLDTFEEFSSAICRLSAQIIRYRAAYVKRLEDVAPAIHREFSGCGEGLALRYKTVGTVTETAASPKDLYERLWEHQQAHRQAEIASGNVLTGVHKDELEIEINGVPARSFASQGQTRTAALSLKMSEREISMLDTGETPVLLLDDVLSELDGKRQEFVLNRIGGGQTLITCCDDGGIASRTGGRVIRVSGGRTKID